MPEPKTIQEAMEDFNAAARKLGQEYARAWRSMVPWYVKARISADEEIATSQQRAEIGRDKHRHRMDWSPYAAIILAAIASCLIIWWAGQ